MITTQRKLEIVSILYGPKLNFTSIKLNNEEKEYDKSIISGLNFNLEQLESELKSELRDEKLKQLGL